MSPEFQKVLKELKKAFPMVPAAISYFAVAAFLGSFFVVYLGLPQWFWASMIGVSGIFGILDYMAGTSILKNLRDWWIKVPAVVHMWVIADCIAYHFLLKAYFSDHIIWEDPSIKLQKS